jgi:hypothetical protein
MSRVPLRLKDKVYMSLTEQPYQYNTYTENESFQVAFKANLSDKVYSNNNEDYLPLNIIEFLYSRAKTSASIHEDFWREARKVERRVPAVVRK